MMNKRKLYVSKEWYNDLANKVLKREELKLGDYTFEVFVHPMLPYDIRYEACDLATHQSVTIQSGEKCHAIFIPALDVEPFTPYIESHREGNKINAALHALFSKIEIYGR